MSPSGGTAKEELETSALEFHCQHIQVLPDGAEVGGKTAHVDVLEKAWPSQKWADGVTSGVFVMVLVLFCGGVARFALFLRTVLESGLSSSTQKTCLCCLEDFQASSRVAVLPCGHIFDEESS